MTGGLAVARVV